MNKEEILAMEAGKALNLLVTEKVMGCIAWEEKRGEYTHVVFQKPDEREPYKRSRNWEKEVERYKRIEYSEINNHIHVVQEIKPYSSDISAAWEVMQKFSNPVGVRVAFGYFIKEIAQLERGVELHDMSVMWSLTPINICKAALLNVMDWEGS